MKIRTQLVVASFLLSILPLSAIVGYSYHSSRKALESAYTREAATLTRQMDRRLATIRTDVEQRLAEVSSLPLHDLPAGENARNAMMGNILLAMGDAASIVDSLEIQPVHRDRRVERGPEPQIAGAAPPAPPAAAEEVRPSEPMVIDIPPPPAIPRFSFSEEQRAQMREIRRLSQALGANGGDLSEEQRKSLTEQLNAVQTAFDAGMKAQTADFQKHLDAAMKDREVHVKLREEQSQKQRAQAERERQAALRETQENAQGVVSQSVAHSVAQSVADAAAAAAPAPAVTAVPTVRTRRSLTSKERALLKVREKQASLLFGQRFHVPIRKEGEIVGQVTAQVSAEEVIRRVLGAAADSDEIAFAIDRDDNVYTRTPEEKKTLEDLGVLSRLKKNLSLRDIPNWVVVNTADVQSGLRIGVARPLGGTFEELRRTAARNFGYGMALVFIALIGIVPLANHITRDVNLVTAGAERIAHGDLMTRLPVTSGNEFGQLASAFNRMAQDLSLQQQTIVEQERARKDQELQQRLLAMEYERKSVELEDARRFQLSMLPKSVPQSERWNIAVYTHTAAEVGGDYYDFHVAPDGVLSVTIGDATGHGAKAGTMVTVIKTLFAGYAADEAPAEFLRGAAEKVKRMDLGRMAMALQLARFDAGQMTVASAGMPPAYVHRASTDVVEEVVVAATPLGTLGADYHDSVVTLKAGDTVLFMSDGFPELLNQSGQQLGYTAAQQEFAAAAMAADADGVIAALAASAERWHGNQPPNDDVTFVVVRARVSPPRPA